MFLSSLMFFAAAAEPINMENGKNAPLNQFADRKEASIAFESMINGFNVKKENEEQILYLDTGGGRWYRAPISCYGMGDPEHAQALGTIDKGFGVDKFTRVRFFGISRFDNADCTLQSLIELSPQETVQFGLETQKMVDKRLEKQAAKKKTQ